MEKYKVTGMSCAACSARVEKAVSGVDGVTACAVNLLTNSMTVEGSADSAVIIKAVTDAGYGAFKDGEERNDEEFDETQETKLLRNRFIASVIFLLVLMYISMGHTMWGFPVPEFFNSVANGISQLILSAIVMIINQKFFINGFKGLINKSPNMDTLVALGSGASFIYSVYALFKLTGDVNSHWVHNFYFESAAMILTLITVGKMLEAHSKGKTTNALKALMKLSPKTAVVIKDGKEVTVDIKDVKVGDIFVVKPGGSIPVDGIVTDGMSAVDESAITGESIPVDKAEGDRVSAATVNKNGFIKCRALRVGEDTTLSQIIKMVSDAASGKAPVAKVADKVSGVFVPAVIGVALVTFIIWMICGESFGFSLSRAVSVLVISCPCALGLATPVAIMVGNGVGAKNGILFKTAAALEECGRTNIAVLDKTGTVTSGEVFVTDIICDKGYSEADVLKYAYALEAKSEHPLSKAIVKKAEDENVGLMAVENFKILPGNGLKGTTDGKIITGGKLDFIDGIAQISDEMKNTAYEFANKGKTPLFFAVDEKLVGIIAVSDTVKDDSKEAVRELKNMGIRVIMLTGDNEKTAKAIADDVGIDEVIANVLPADKEKTVRTLKEYGKVMMVGDGINDAPSLTSADVGVAIGAGTDVAIDAADVVLVKSRLKDAAAAIRLSRATLKNIHENLFWAFIYNVIGIPLAAGAWIHLFNITLNPMFGAAAMSLSSFCVVTNALRLNFKDVYNTQKDKKIKSKKEKKTMEKTMKIEGMMCMHCSGRVKKCLEELEGVEEAVVSHENGTAIVKLSKDVSDDVLKKTVEDQGYKVL